MNKGRAGIFITGTDTGVGKTYIAAAIARALRRRGIDVGVMKPVETGCGERHGELLPSDAIALRKASGCADSLDHVNPYRFRKPLAPAVASRMEGTRIDPRRIAALFDRLRDSHQFMIVEGAGGILVPVTERCSYLDLAETMKLPVVVVARPGLGTINHTLLTIRALQQRDLRITGIVINYTSASRTGIAERTNPEMIRKISGIPVLGIVRHGAKSVEPIIGKIVSRRAPRGVRK